MNREVHVRFWERPEVKLLRATRQCRWSREAYRKSAYPAIAGTDLHPAVEQNAPLADIARSSSGRDPSANGRVHSDPASEAQLAVLKGSSISYD